MSTDAATDWRKDFGIEGRNPPSFFADSGDISTVAAPQAHVLRRAFEDLKLCGVLCQDNNPIIYFRLVERINPKEVSAIHRSFWNQGVAPILVFIDSDQVHVYSGLAEPELSQNVGDTPSGFIETLKRVGKELQSFILAVESGEYFHQHRKSFDPKHRVDRNLLRHLEDTHDLLAKVPAAKLDRLTLHALLCRLVFTCYLFDRKIIDGQYLADAGIADAEHLRDILRRKRRSEAKYDLYNLFAQLGQDFNGDLFSENLDSESKQVKAEHLDILSDFIHGTDPSTGQQSFWPYEFGIIPIETISAIYEHFLKAAGTKEKKEAGAFYTPRFLAELVLDRALEGETRLLDKTFLDPACGSGIFLVGLLNRLSEEWSRDHPNAGYDAKLNGLTTILKTNLFGIDKSRSACLIAAFSLYLALLDQLSPPDIRRVLKKVRVLPRLVQDDGAGSGTIRCADIFTEAGSLSTPVDFVIGNPPWAKAKDSKAPASLWCAARQLPFPGKQLASAFVWKATEYLSTGGKACFVLPHGLLFNHTQSAIDFQLRWFQTHAVDVILNLADYQRFLFEEAEAPAIVVRFAKERPADNSHRINYWSPKSDWAVTQAEVISILPQDRASLTIREVLEDLRGEDAPLIWKERYWATLRDRRLLDRMRLYPRLRSILGQRGKGESKRWIIAEGFEPFGQNDPPSSLRKLSLTQTAKVEASTHDLDLFLTSGDCDIKSNLELKLRRGITETAIFTKPLVLVTEGFSNVAFANLNVAYRHGIRGIHGPVKDTSLLAFLTFYLRSKLARYFLFHTSASWGVSRARVDIDDLMRLPFPLPEQANNPARAREIIAEVGQIMAHAAKKVARITLGRDNVVDQVQCTAELLIDEYFDVIEMERVLIRDTNTIIIPSVRPTRVRVDVPTILPATDVDYSEYIKLICATLNQWASTNYEVHGRVVSDNQNGVGMVVLEKTQRGARPEYLNGADKNILSTLHSLQRGAAKGRSTIEIARGLKVFDKTLLYISKPIGRRFWSRSAALNDADEIAGTILARPGGEDA